MEDKQLTDNFYLSEFNYVYPELELLDLLQSIRTEIDNPVIIISSTRTFEQHIDIYKEKYGNAWEDFITLDSRHLPCFKTTNLRAVDIISKGYSGIELCEIAKNISIDKSIRSGLWYSAYSLHVDVDRKELIVGEE